MTVRFIQADVFEGIRLLADNCVHCVCTSVPYWGLRSYLPEGHPDKPKEIGQEATLAEHLDVMVRVFREVRRVLRKDGVLWLNYGDAYAGSWGAQGRQGKTGQMAGRSVISARQIGHAQRKASKTGSVDKTPGLKPKDLMMLPARVALALVDDGWWLRSDCIWAKSSPMPESVTDRPTSAHEHVFMFTKSARYFYDAEAVREGRTQDEDANGFRGGSYVCGVPGPRKATGNKRIKTATHENRNVAGFNGRWDEAEANGDIAAGRNMRNVWTHATEPFSDAHFATMPSAIAERCIKAGCPVGGVVLDPFGGAGTTAMVADRLGRSAIHLDLSADYCAMAERRIARDRLERGEQTMANVAAAKLQPTPIEALIASSRIQPLIQPA